MSIFMTLLIALKALNRNKMRTMLTMLGMIIGVGAVITMVAIGKGAQQQHVAPAGAQLVALAPRPEDVVAVRSRPALAEPLGVTRSDPDYYPLALGNDWTQVQLFENVREPTSAGAVASTAARKATQTGPRSFTQPAQVLGWLAGGRRAQAALTQR